MANYISVDKAMNVLMGFHEIEEAPFLPAYLTGPVHELMSSTSFAELSALATPSNRKAIDAAPQKLRQHGEEYNSYQKALKDTPNVFSSSVDFI